MRGVQARVSQERGRRLERERGSRDGGSRAPRPPRPASGELSHPRGGSDGATRARMLLMIDPPPDGAWLAHVRAPTRELVAGEREVRR